MAYFDWLLYVSPFASQPDINLYPANSAWYAKRVTFYEKHERLWRAVLEAALNEWYEMFPSAETGKVLDVMQEAADADDDFVPSMDTEEYMEYMDMIMTNQHKKKTR